MHFLSPNFLNRLWSVGVLLVLGGGAAHAQTISFRKIADTGTAVPEGTGSFASLGAHPALRAGRTVFIGTDGVGAGGVYLHAGAALTVVANSATPIPGGAGNFESFTTASYDGTNVAFRATGAGQLGIYLASGGPVQKIADLSTSIPGGTGNFTDFTIDSPSIDGNTVVFVGKGSGGQAGVYKSTGGVLSMLANQATTAPGGGGTFATFDHPSVYGDRVCFRGFASAALGIYTSIGGTLAVVADSSTPLPGGGGNYVTFGKGSTGSAGVAFRAGPSLDQIGVHGDLGGVLAVVADTATPVPGGTGNFEFEFVGGDAPSVDASDVAFAGGEAGEFGSGIYGLIAGELREFLGYPAVLDGKDTDFATAGPQALQGLGVAFRVTFTDTSQGIYVSTVGIPTVSAWALVVMTLLLLSAGTLAAGRKRCAC